MKHHKWQLSILLLGMLQLIPLQSEAQQTIFNVPSADVTPQGEIFLQHESQFRPWKPNDYWVGTHYAAVGIGHNTELDATLINAASPASDNLSLMLGAKSAIPVLVDSFPTREFKLTVGGMLPVSLQGNGVDYWGYGHLSGRIPKLNTRLTAGVSAGGKNLFGRDGVSFMGGYEQPLNKRISLNGDWYSGTHGLGFFIPGFSLVISPTSTMYFGYQIPNNTQCGRSGLVFEWAKFF